MPKISKNLVKCLLTTNYLAITDEHVVYGGCIVVLRTRLLPVQITDMII